MFDTPITDTHVHLWDPARLRYDWHDGLPKLNRRFLLQEYAEATGDAPIQRMVFLECACAPEQNLDEIAMVSELAATDARLQGIVAFAPLELGEGVRPELTKLAANPLVKGIRRITQGEDDPDFCNRPDFVRGVKMLAEFGMSCDLCICYRQMANTIELVRSCPEVNFVLDHIGKPNIRGGEMEPWARQLKELAALPNCWCKLSGVVTEAEHESWREDDILPYMQQALDCFGPGRLIYGGDWPVVLLASPYQRWLATVESFLAPLDKGSRQQIMHDNAGAFYRL